MSLAVKMDRAMYALSAMSALLAVKTDKIVSPETIAKASFDIAEAMIKEQHARHTEKH